LTDSVNLNTDLTKDLGIEYPIIGGPMYPCGNPELVAAISNAGGIGVVQPITLTYVNNYEFRAGLRYIKSLSNKPIGMNALIEQSSKRYRQKMEAWVDIALEEGVRFFITSLGKPDWVVEKAHNHDAKVYHDVTELKWAQKGLDCGVDGLIAVNNRAGGHAGKRDMRELYELLSGQGKPLVCAGGIATAEDFIAALKLGYAGVQLGTRFIVTQECTASELYKQAILDATEKDIVMTEKVTGVPVSIINTKDLKEKGTELSGFSKKMLKGKRSKYLMRMLLAIRSFRQLKASFQDNSKGPKYWQAGKSVAGCKSIETVDDIIQSFVKAA